MNNADNNVNTYCKAATNNSSTLMNNTKALETGEKSKLYQKMKINEPNSKW
jgi:hypothetical protein